MHIQSNPNPRVALVVDDDELVLDVTASLLQDLGFETYSEPSGKSALDRLREDGSIGLLLTDYSMPGMSGTELIGQALQDRPDLRVILASGYLEERPGLNESVVFLRKPYSKGDLIQAVGSTLSST